MKMLMKKTMVMIFLLLFVVGSVSISVQAGELWEPIMDFTVWNSNESMIGVFTESTVKVYADYNYLSFHTMDELCTAVSSAWGALVSFTFVSSPDDCNILFTDILREDVHAEMAEYDPLGYTLYPDISLYGYGMYGSARRTIQEFDKIEVYLVIESADFTLTNALYEELEITAVHEFGHAIGYYGHDVNATATNKSIMYPYSYVMLNEWGINTPQQRDFDHMGGVY